MGIPTNPLERAATAGVGAEPPRAVVFEAVGIPGIIDTVSRAVPPATRIVVVGVCMQTDRIEPSLALVKELELRFAFGYTVGVCYHPHAHRQFAGGGGAPDHRHDRHRWCWERVRRIAGGRADQGSHRTLSMYGLRDRAG
jgi:hypothetical protein